MKFTHSITSLVVASALLSPTSPSFALNDTRTVTVFAASSLTRVFTTLGTHFEAAHPGVTVRFSFASSITLATQIKAGAPADIFASADATSMSSVSAQVPHPVD